MPELSDSEKLKLIVERLPGILQALANAESLLDARKMQWSDLVLVDQSIHQAQGDVEFCQAVADGKVQP
jgi:hypothetical protein